MASKYNLVWVAFKKPTQPHLQPSLGVKKNWFFTSLAAIFDVFTSEQVGCHVYDLWNEKLSFDKPFNAGNCTIMKATAITKKQKAHGEDKT